MKKLITNIITILVIVGVVIFIQHKYFPREIDISTHTSDTVWQDSIHIEYYPKPYPVFIDTNKVKIITLPTDSAAITKAYLKLHKDFNSIYFYKDTLQNDSLGLGILDAEITQNRPKKYTFSYFDRTPSVINNTTNIYSQNEFYIGLNNTAPSVLFKSKKGWMIGGGYDLVDDRQRIKIQGYINLNKIFKNE